jgi:SAM-dependent methyltransferase
MNPRSDPDMSIAFYDQHAEEYIQSTLHVDIHDLYVPFLALLPEGGHILDAGCGSGRDAKFFLSRGYQVKAFDGSREMARIASTLTGLSVMKMRFGELIDNNAFDGIWACASLLHVRRGDLAEVFCRLERALREGGVLYASFKQRETDHALCGRQFTNFMPEKLREFVEEQTRLVIVNLWETLDCRPDHRDERWVNLLAQRQEAATCLSRSPPD